MTREVKIVWEELTLLDTLEECIVIGTSSTSCLFIRVVSQHLPSVYIVSFGLTQHRDHQAYGQLGYDPQ